MLKGFRDFVIRGNLVELAVAFIMAAAFGLVITATVTVVMDVIGKLGGSPNFSGYAPGGVHLGAWFTAVISFLILAAVVYFMIVVPYQRAMERLTAPDEAAPDTTAEPLSEDTRLLTEIRDLLARRP
jgi:large conductance mechanosensitive channel